MTSYLVTIATHSHLLCETVSKGYALSHLKWQVLVINRLWRNSRKTLWGGVVAPPLLVRLRVNIRTMYKITIFIHGFSISISNHYDITIYLPNYDYKRGCFSWRLCLKFYLKTVATQLFCL